MPPIDDEDDLIFKRTPETLEAQAQKVRDQLVAEKVFEIEFTVDNNKIWFSHSHTEVPLKWIAAGIVEAVQEWSAEHVAYKPRTADALSEVGAPKITYRQIVTIDWANKTIRTSLKQTDGQLFLRVMAYFVEQFNTPQKKPQTEGKAN